MNTAAFVPFTRFLGDVMKLTDVNVKKAKPREKMYKLFDGGGLYIQIEPTGGKLWRYQYRFEEKRKLLSLGKYPDVSLQEARKRHMEAREQLAQGIDPSAVKKARKIAGKERAANSFEVVAREWFARWKDNKADYTIKRTLSILEKNILPWIGTRPVSDIKTPDVLAVLRRIEDRGFGETTRKTRDAISGVFRYAVQTGRTEYNPCDNLRGALKPVQVKNLPSITEPEKVAELLRAIDTYQGGPVVRAALRLAPLVFVRPGELRAAKWTDIDLDRAEWRFVTSKTKTEHLVPLARQAVEILKDLYPLTGSREYVFPNVRYRFPSARCTIFYRRKGKQNVPFVQPRLRKIKNHRRKSRRRKTSFR